MEQNKAVEIIKTIGIIVDLANDILDDAGRAIVRKDKAPYLSEIKDGCYAIIGYVEEIEKELRNGNT